MDIRCIALDLDRTTLDEHGRLPEENRRALEAAMARPIFGQRRLMKAFQEQGEILETVRSGIVAISRGPKALGSKQLKADKTEE